MKYLIPLIVVLFFSCNQSEVRTNALPTVKLDYSNTVGNLYDFIDSASIEFIQLETNDECLLGRISKVEVENDIFYICSNNKVYLFNSEGKYLRKIGKRGKGPRECLQITDISIDDSLYVYDRKTDKVLIYSLNGEYAREFNAKLKTTSYFTHLRDDYYAFTSSYMHSDQKGRVVILQENKRTSMKGYLPQKNEYMLWRIYIGAKVFDDHKGEKLVRLTADDTIYKVTSKGVSPYLNIDFGKYSLPLDLRKKEYSNIKAFNDENNYRFVSTFGYYSSDDHLILRFTVKEQNGAWKKYSCFYNWKTGVTKTISSIDSHPIFKTKFNLDVFYGPTCCSNDSFYSMIYHSSLKHYQDKGKEPVVDVNLNSNPILMKYKVKL